MSGTNLESPTIPWKDMFCSASFRMPKSDPFSATLTPDVGHGDHALQTLELSALQVPEKNVQPSSSVNTPQVYDQSSLSSNRNSDDSPTVPWQAMFRTASFRRPTLSPSNHNPWTDNNTLSPVNTSQDNPIIPDLRIMPLRESSITSSQESNNESDLCTDAIIWAAVYIILGQAALTVLKSLSYGVPKLLEEYIWTIIWASLCSIPLRGIQDTLVEFWSEPLEAGLTDAILAIPIAIIRALNGTIIDARIVSSWVFYGENQLEEVKPEKNGFLRLVRRLVSFSIFVFAYEQIGRFGAFTLIGLRFMLSSKLSPSIISRVSALRSDSFRGRRSTSAPQERGMFLNLGKISRLLSQWLLSRLKTILAVGLIIGMFAGIFAGLVFFTYKIGAEGQDAVISIKTHLEPEKIGKKWIYGNHAIDLMDWYTSECYETIFQQIDKFASRYNLSELIEVVKQFAVTPYVLDDFPENSSIFLTPRFSKKYTIKLRNLMKKPVLNKAKCLATQGMDLWYWVFTNSKFLFEGSAHFLLNIMVSGAAGILQFLLESIVFFWVLYYLLTSESGGVTELAVKVLPLQEAVKSRCIEALNNAVSGVLLATAEIAFFQGCFTWLLCRLYSIHFVYVSTMLAFISPLVPIFPTWVLTLPGTLELVLDGRYLLAISFCMTGILVVDYGASEIAESVPGYTTCLTGVSIIGGMTLFPSALEVIFLIICILVPFYLPH